LIKFGVILPVRYGWPYVQASVESLFAPAASEQIAASLANCAPAAAGFLRSPPKVAAIAALNATPCGGQSLSCGGHIIVSGCKPNERRVARGHAV